MVDNKKRWMFLPLIVALLTFLAGFGSDASTLQSLRDARKAAWDIYYISDDDNKTEMEQGIVINGAVDTDGGAKIMIDSFQNRGMLKEGESLFVYDTPEEGNVAGKIYADTIFSILSVEGAWTKIQSGYLVGYVQSSHIVRDDAAEKKADEICPEFFLSNVGNTAVKAATDTDSNTIQYLGQRQAYNIVDFQGDYYEITPGENTKGYVLMSEVDKVREIHIGRTLVHLNSPQQPFLKERVTAKERKLLAAIIFCEARGEIFEGQIAVGSVVMNRVKSDLFPNSMEEVIYQKNQFEPVQLNRLAEALENDSMITSSCYEAADVVLQGGNNIGEALYFRTGDVGTVVGSHGFY